MEYRTCLPIWPSFCPVDRMSLLPMQCNLLRFNPLDDGLSLCPILRSSLMLNRITMRLLTSRKAPIMHDFSLILFVPRREEVRRAAYAGMSH